MFKEDLKDNEVERTGKARFLAIGKACKATYAAYFCSLLGQGPFARSFRLSDVSLPKVE